MPCPSCQEIQAGLNTAQAMIATGNATIAVGQATVTAGGQLWAQWMALWVQCCTGGALRSATDPLPAFPVGDVSDADWNAGIELAQKELERLKR